MKQHPVTINGEPDTRYSIEKEDTLNIASRFVARFCGEWIGQSQFYSSAVLLAIDHNSRRKGAMVTEIDPRDAEIATLRAALTDCIESGQLSPLTPNTIRNARAALAGGKGGAR